MFGRGEAMKDARSGTTTKDRYSRCKMEASSVDLLPVAKHSIVGRGSLRSHGTQFLKREAASTITAWNAKPSNILLSLKDTSLDSCRATSLESQALLTRSFPSSLRN